MSDKSIDNEVKKIVLDEYKILWDYYKQTSVFSLDRVYRSHSHRRVFRNPSLRLFCF